MNGRTLWRNARVATLVGGWGVVERGAVLAENGRIAWAGPEARLPARLPVAHEHDLGGALLTPGLVDAHTHLVYAGNRAAEFEQRLAGASYEDIARAGGGIRATLAATRAAGDGQLQADAIRRALALRAGGVTTVEVKSGYGLELEAEARCLRAARAIGPATGQSVLTTFLGLHAVPPEFTGRADDYVEAVCTWLPLLHREGLVDAVDAWCEGIAFTPAQARRVFAAARALDLPVKLHAGQFGDVGGAELAAESGALSCDHLEWLSPAGIAALRDAGTVAVLLPGAFYTLRETRVPPVAALRAAGVPLAVATDHNPGSSPLLSLPLAMNMACTLFGLAPLEAWLGATVHAARALGLRDRGTIAHGQRADLAAWDLEHPRELVHGMGHPPCRATWTAS